jgi:sulfonate dioxygenase
MATTTITNITEALPASLKLRGASPDKSSQTPVDAKTIPSEDEYPYKVFLPHFDPSAKLPPLEPFEHVDPGHAALKDANPRAFLADAKVGDLTPKFGAEVEGIQLHKLNAKEKRWVEANRAELMISQLALFVAQRGIVVFRDQEFQDQTPEWMLEEWGS